ncbi:MAG: M24 family metallopeptidase [Chloroflexota bacterium]|nr:M24 family metallopeptidase [Chloroflexota bacterium]
MKSDIDKLLKENQAEALWVTGPAQHNPAMVYLMGGGHITQADAIKIPGKPVLLCHPPMERDEAVRTGLPTLNYNKYPLNERLKLAGGDRLTAQALLYKNIFEEIGVTSGKVIIYGHTDVGKFLLLVNRLHEMLPGLIFEGDLDDAVLLQAMATKEPEEIERIRHMGEIVKTVVSRVADFLTEHKVDQDVLIKKDGTPLLIGDVKGLINLWLAELGAENPEDTIFAIGRDAGVPHSSGTPTDPIKLGQTIVFDIFPCEKGGGYFYDFTRTWCLGYAPEKTQQLYDQVKSVYEQVVSELEINQNAAQFQARTCALFEAMGHTTPRQDPQVESGYVHSLGHGVGLNIHEKPWFSRKEDATNALVPGSVFTIEPGLYYPEKGMGVRLEDTYHVTSQGEFKRFVDYPKELVLKMK